MSDDATRPPGPGWEGDETLTSSQCDYCRFKVPAPPRMTKPYCDSFPGGVPDEVLDNSFDHRRPYYDDDADEVTFEPIPGKEAEAAENYRRAFAPRAVPHATDAAVLGYLAASPPVDED